MKNLSIADRETSAGIWALVKESKGKGGKTWWSETETPRKCETSPVMNWECSSTGSPGKFGERPPRCIHTLSQTALVKHSLFLKKQRTQPNSSTITTNKPKHKQKLDHTDQNKKQNRQKPQQPNPQMYKTPKHNKKKKPTNKLNQTNLLIHSYILSKQHGFVAPGGTVCDRTLASAPSQKLTDFSPSDRLCLS